jgi:hypothetical protein
MTLRALAQSPSSTPQEPTPLTGPRRLSVLRRGASFSSLPSPLSPHTSSVAMHSASFVFASVLLVHVFAFPWLETKHSGAQATSIKHGLGAMAVDEDLVRRTLDHHAQRKPERRCGGGGVYCRQYAGLEVIPRGSVSLSGTRYNCPAK